MEISQVAIARLIFYAFLLGIALGILYDAIRLLRFLRSSSDERVFELENRIKLPLLPPRKPRKQKKHFGVFLFLEDFFYAVFTGIALILLFYQCNNGIIRFPALLSCICGFFAYRKTLGKIVLRMFVWIAFGVRTAWRYIVFLICLPGKLVLALLKKTLGALLGRLRRRRAARARIRMTAAEWKRLERDAAGMLFDFREG